MEIKGFAGAKRRRSPIFGMQCRKINSFGGGTASACVGKLRDSPERSEGEDQFSAACVGKLFIYMYK
jgi:hypothetical protein